MNWSTTTTKITTIVNGCGSPQWSNDKWCDDDNNNAGCNFDDGACCNNFFNGWNTYCQVTSDYYYVLLSLIIISRKINVNFMQVCECLETTKTTASTSTTTASTSTTLSGCGSPQWAKDQWCDDENNNAGCEFDGGACCNNNLVGWDTFCQVNIS